MGGHELTDGLDVIAPGTRSVQFRGRTVVISPLRVGQLPAFARAIRPIAGMLDNVDSFGPAQILDLLADHGENILSALFVSTGLPLDELESADPVELIALASVTIQVNADFFGRSLRGFQMPQAMVNPGSGPTPSQP